MSRGMIREKYAGERILWPYWLLMMIILGGGIVVGSIIVRNPNVNIREIEARVLSEKLERCFFEGGELSESVTSEEFEFMRDCKLNFNDVSGTNQYYALVEIYEYEKCQAGGKCEGEPVIFNKRKMRFSGGDVSLYSLCEMAKKKGRGVPECSSEPLYFVKNGKEYYLRAVGVVNKAKQNVM